ncbi:YkvA family protein [Carnobacterium funditum]|uniref:YkvA family protein n=1 Tax=Carnobacterium funditum TaxID=2752 RepID=UPI00068F79A5|nr:YkvA family protein [Carnobacterium funditum]
MKAIQKKNKRPVGQVEKLILSLFSKKISRKKKLMAAAIVLYIISPFDFIPDFIPLVGYADDVILPILLMITDKLLSENKESTRNQPIKEAEKI